jgi:hypothetical protein
MARGRESWVRFPEVRAAPDREAEAMATGIRTSGRPLRRNRKNVRRATRAALIVGAVKARKTGTRTRQRRAAAAELQMKKGKPLRKARARAR